MSNWFRRLGLVLRGPFTRARWVFYEFTGTDAEALRAEGEAGEHISRELRRKHPLFTNQSYQAYVQDMGAYLQRFILESHPYQFVCAPVESRSINAFAIPGGKVFVSRGLLEFVEWERDQIAFAIAHEIGHIVHGDVARRLVASTVRDGASVFFKAFKVSSVVASLSNAYVFSEYSQDCELHADRFAATLLKRAHMDPRAGIALLRRLDSIPSIHRSAITDRFFSSHPAIHERIRNIESHC